MIPEQKKPLDPYKCISDHEFQDWLATTKLITRTPEYFLPPNIINFNPKRPAVLLKTLLDLLNQNRGYVIDLDTASIILFGRSGPVEREQTGNWSRHLESRLDEPKKLLRIRKLGFAIGVERVNSFMLNPSFIPVIYRLWQELGEYVYLGELANALYGLNEPTGRRNIMDNIMYPLRKVYLPPTKAKINHLGAISARSAEAGDLLYKLYTKNNK